MTYAGIDGCKYGWILTKSTAGNIQYGGIYQTIHQLLLAHQELTRVLIDIPIGLSSEGKIRTVEQLLRKQLGHRKSTVFNAPCRAALSAESYGAAKSINQQIEGKSLSKQTYFISQKIAEVDQLFQQKRSMRKRFIESHPELCFKHLNNGVVLDKKSTALGIEQRIRVLEVYYPSIKGIFKEILEKTQRKQVKKDDILDALCLCLVNQLSGIDSMRFITDPLLEDELGIKMRIGYYVPIVSKKE